MVAANVTQVNNGQNGTVFLSIRRVESLPVVLLDVSISASVITLKMEKMKEILVNKCTECPFCYSTRTDLLKCWHDDFDEPIIILEKDTDKIQKWCPMKDENSVS